MYAKVFASLWDGTLGQEWEGWTVFVFMLANCGPDGVLDMTPATIAARSRLPMEAVEKGLGILERPDRDSRREEEQGRRIVRLDEHRSWGWRITNYAYYRGLRDEDQRRAEARARMAKLRDSRKEECSPSVRHGSPPFAQEEVEVKEEAEKKEPTPASAIADLRTGFHPVPKSKALRKAKDTFSGAALPEWLDPEVWSEWCQYRASLKRVPWTEQAAKLSLKAMTEIHESGGSPRDAVDTSILNGWKGLFPERNAGHKTAQNMVPERITTGGGYLRGLKDHEADERRRSCEPTRVGFSLPRLQADK